MFWRHGRLTVADEFVQHFVVYM